MRLCRTPGTESDYQFLKTPGIGALEAARTNPKILQSIPLKVLAATISPSAMSPARQLGGRHRVALGPRKSTNGRRKTENSHGEKRCRAAIRCTTHNHAADVPIAPPEPIIWGDRDRDGGLTLAQRSYVRALALARGNTDTILRRDYGPALPPASMRQEPYDGYARNQGVYG